MAVVSATSADGISTAHRAPDAAKIVRSPNATTRADHCAAHAYLARGGHADNVGECWRSRRDGATARHFARTATALRGAPAAGAVTTHPPTHTPTTDRSAKAATPGLDAAAVDAGKSEESTALPEAPNLIYATAASPDVNARVRSAVRLIPRIQLPSNRYVFVAATTATSSNPSSPNPRHECAGDDTKQPMTHSRRNFAPSSATRNTASPHSSLR